MGSLWRMVVRRTPGPLLATSVISIDMDAVCTAKYTCGEEVMGISISEICVLFYKYVTLEFLKVL